MQIKKLTPTLLFIVCILAAVLGFTACKEEEHVHTFSEWETMAEATCFSHGMQKRSCECGHVEYGTTQTLEHTPVVDAAIDATCTSHGMTEGSHCSVCNAIIVPQTQTEKLEHTYSEWKTIAQASCTSHGLQERSCECGHVEYQILETLSHNFSQWETVSEATCTSHGLQKRICTCGYIEYDTTDMLVHTPVLDPAVSADCTSYGKTEGSHCKTCGVVLVHQELVLPSGHNCDKSEIIKEATSGAKGSKRISCSNAGCSYSYEEEFELAELSIRDIQAEALNYIGTIQPLNFWGGKLDSATAFVIDPDGIIITSNFALDNAYSAFFTLNGQKYDVVEVLAYEDHILNVAVLKIDATGLPAANICKDPLAITEKVYLAGVSDRNTFSISECLLPEEVDPEKSIHFFNYNIDLPFFYNGGPMLNTYGEVVGINAGMLGNTGFNQLFSMHVLDFLKYDNPMSIEEYGKKTYTHDEYFEEWLWHFNNMKTDSNIEYQLSGSDYTLSLGYDIDNDYSYIAGSFKISSTKNLYIRISLNDKNEVYQYYATLIEGNNRNEVYGYIDAATYDGSGRLTYDTFYGKYWAEDYLMNMYTLAVHKVIGWFSHCLDTYFVDQSLETYGFDAVDYSYDENALDKLNDFVEKYGEFNEQTGAYEIAVTLQPSSVVTAIYMIEYFPGNDEVAGSTVVTVQYNHSSGVIYVVSLTLDPTEEGLRFDALYAPFNGVDYDIQNEIWGYLDPAIFTDTTRLSGYVVSGHDEYEDAFLNDYAYILSYLLECTNSIMGSVSPELSIRDLGFIFFNI